MLRQGLLPGSTAEENDEQVIGNSKIRFQI